MIPHFIITMSVTEILLIGLFLLVVLINLILTAHTAFIQWRCPHAEVHESRACDAICRKCGKNLGFIGKWREEHRG